jgi:hypothetical protein
MSAIPIRKNARMYPSRHITLPTDDAQRSAPLYRQTTDANLRTRCQMVLPFATAQFRELRR